MLKINRQTDYAVRVVLALAQRGEGTPLSSADIQKEMLIPKAFKTRIVAQLAREGLVNTYPGRDGGLMLPRPASQITLKEVVEAFRGAGSAVESMVALNDVAGAALVEFRARACTDVTGFGLAGHAAEVALASEGVRLVFDASALALLPGTARLAQAGMLTGGGRRNRNHLGRRLSLSPDVAPVLGEVVVDPQTSGGLLVSLPERHATGYARRLHDRGVRPAIVGRVEARPRRSSTLVVVE